MAQGLSFDVGSARFDAGVVSIRDNARPVLRRLERKVNNPGPGLLVAARAVGNMLRKHYRARNQEGNRLGGQRTNFWLEVGRGVQAPREVSEGHVTLSINHPAIRQKIFGGTIRAKNAKALTIPIHPEAHGRRVSVLERRLGQKLFRVGDVLLGSESGKLIAYYVLRAQVTQKADPRALPPREEMEQEARTRFWSWVSR